MVVFDTTFLRLLLRPDADPPHDPNSGNPISLCQSRIKYLIEVLEADRETILIPTPALSELLVVENQFGPNHLTVIDKYSVFRIVEFDRRAAIELAAFTRTALSSGNKNDGISAPWAKIKFDRQIVAIAKVNQAHTVYSDDDDLRKAARKVGLTAVGVHELPLKPDPPQHEMDLEPESE